MKLRYGHGTTYLFKTTKLVDGKEELLPELLDMAKQTNASPASPNGTKP